MAISGNQLKAARALLGFDQKAVAEKTGVGINTVRSMEAAGAGNVRSRTDTLDAIIAALEAGGIEFTNGDQPGVRLRKQLETVATLTEKIEELQEVLPAVEPETEPSPEKAMERLRHARTENEIVKLKSRCKRLKSQSKE
jgi:transcriptional regulator with XRE-family HTH domain